MDCFAHEYTSSNMDCLANPNTAPDCDINTYSIANVDSNSQQHTYQDIYAQSNIHCHIN